MSKTFKYSEEEINQQFKNNPWKQKAINEAFNHQFNPYPNGYTTPPNPVQQPQNNSQQAQTSQIQNPSAQNEKDKLLEIKKLELEVEKLRLLKNVKYYNTLLYIF